MRFKLFRIHFLSLFITPKTIPYLVSLAKNQLHKLDSIYSLRLVNWVAPIYQASKCNFFKCRCWVLFYSNLWIILH